MNLIQGKQYRVKQSHKFHPGKVGTFLFMGGPDADVVVLQQPSGGGWWIAICIGLEDVEDLG